MLVIVDYGVGNLGSIANMLKRIGIMPVISSRAEDVLTADKIILPGVGAFAYAMEKLGTLGLIEPLSKQVLEHKVPILGICLGVQLFTKRSDEGDVPGLGWIEAETVRFRFDSQDQTLRI